MSYVGKHRAPQATERAWVPEPTIPCPTMEEIMELEQDGDGAATDGCLIESDGWCEHGHPSWLIELGLI